MWVATGWRNRVWYPSATGRFIFSGKSRTVLHTHKGGICYCTVLPPCYHLWPFWWENNSEHISTVGWSLWLHLCSGDSGDLQMKCDIGGGSHLCNLWYDMLYLLTAIGLPPGGSSTVHIYTQTIHRTTQNKQYTEQHNNLGECGPCPVLASYTLAFALQLRKKHGKTSVRVAASKNT